MKNSGRLLKIASNQMVRGLDDFAKQFDLTWTQMSVIDYLGNQEVCTQKQIEQEFYIQRSTATVMLQRLEKKGLICREVCANDERQKVIKLTPKAQPLLAKVHTFMQVNQADFEANFSANEILIFEKVMQYFIERGHRDEKN